MSNCIFCKIIEGELPSYTIYEDDIIKVIMNINPDTDGHLLVIPKKHYVNILDIDEDVLSHCMEIIRNKLYKKLKKDLKCKGITIAQNNEHGQEIKHFHIHLIPRYENDEADFKYKDNISDLETVFNKLK